MKQNEPDLTMRSVHSLQGWLQQGIFLKSDGTIWQCADGKPDVKIEPKFNSNNKGYLEFGEDVEDGKFTLWLSRAFYEAFVGKIPAGYEVIHRDRNRSNFRPDNLVLRAKPARRTLKLLNGPIAESKSVTASDAPPAA
jgi:hypothetical protein